MWWEMVGMQRVSVGDTVTVMLPWSEVCLHMRVADQVRDVRVLADGAQILNADGSRFSGAITHGEAGIMTDADGLYVPASGREYVKCPEIGWLLLTGLGTVKVSAVSNGGVDIVIVDRIERSHMVSRADHGWWVREVLV